MLATYTTPDFLAAIQDWWAILLALVAVGVWLIRREIRQWKQEISEEIKSATAPIQPETNGGKSLADVHTKLDALARADVRVESRIAALEQSQRDHLAAHRAEERGDR